MGDRDEGSGTVHGLTLAAVLCTLLIALLLVAQAGIATHRAAKAADLAALAAADVARGLSPGIPCETAQAVARENGADAVECEVVAPENTTVDVTATTARARAGQGGRQTVVTFFRGHRPAPSVPT